MSDQPIRDADLERWATSLHEPDPIPRLSAEVRRLRIDARHYRGALGAIDRRHRAAGEKCGLAYEQYGCDWPDAAAEEVVRLRNENARLLRGSFTEAEFQNLCHHFTEDDAARFRQGCAEYQRKLFGYEVPAPPAAEVQRLRNENAGLAKAEALLRAGLESQCERMDGLKQRVRELEAENADLRRRAEPAWVPVAERLPPEETMVLLWCPGGAGVCAGWRRGPGWWNTDGRLGPTHWRPWPEAPTQGDPTP